MPQPACDASLRSDGPPEALPVVARSELRNGCYFQFSNALCFEIFLGPPLIIYAQTLGASAIMIGLLGGMVPLTSPLQLAVADRAAKTGFPVWVSRGWRSRNLLILAVALMPFIQGNPDAASWKIALLAIILAIYCMWLQIITAGWLPWINNVLTKETRGWYVVREQAAILLGGTITIIISAALLHFLPLQLGFSAVFLWSFAGGMLAWFFLRRVPTSSIPPIGDSVQAPFSWRGMWLHKAFRNLVFCNLAWIAAQGALVIHGLLFLRDRMGVSEAGCLAAVLSLYLGGLASLLLLRRIEERLSGKTLALGAWAGVSVGAAGWLFLAIRDERMPLPVYSALFLLHGISMAPFTFAYMRELMRVTPAPGSERFFAMHSVLANVAMWVTPVAWGVVIEGMNQSRTTSPIDPAGFRLFYAGVLAFLALVPALLWKGAFPRHATDLKTG